MTGPFFLAAAGGTGFEQVLFVLVVVVSVLQFQLLRLSGNRK